MSLVERGQGEGEKSVPLSLLSPCGIGKEDRLACIAATIDMRIGILELDPKGLGHEEASQRQYLLSSVEI